MVGNPRRSPQPPQQVQQNSNGSAPRGSDYVYFERSTAGFSKDAVPKATAAKMKLEHFYKVAVESAIERNKRCVAHIISLSPQKTRTNENSCSRLFYILSNDTDE
jgi:protein-serine/threonine kinase